MGGVAVKEREVPPLSVELRVLFGQWVWRTRVVVPESKRGLAFGFFGTSLGILSLPMPWIGAQLWEIFSPQAPFWITAMLCAVAIPIAWIKFKHEYENISDNPLPGSQTTVSEIDT